MNKCNTKLCFRSIVGEKLFISIEGSLNLPFLSQMYYHFIYIYVIPDSKKLGEVNLQNQVIGQCIKTDDKIEVNTSLKKFNFVLYLSAVSPGLCNFYTHILTSYSIFKFPPEILCASTSLPFF